MARRAGWPARAGRWLARPFAAALVTGVADPPPPPPRWRTPGPLQRLGRGLRIPRVDLVVLAEIGLTIAIFAGMNSVFIDANQRAGMPVGQGELLIFAAAGSSLPVLLRGRWPLAAWRVSLPCLVLVALVTEQVSGPGAPEVAPPAGAVIMYLLVLYAVGVRSPRHISFGVWVVSVAGMAVLYPSSAVVLGAIMMAVPLLYGYNVRVRRQAQRQVAAEEQRTEDERAARAVLEERSRIARELHDVVAHHMSVIAIQAEAAPIKSPGDPEALRAELAGIRGTALEALTELRRVLGVLRTGDQLPDTAPQPGIADVDRLLGGLRAAGLAVTLTTSGRPPVAPGGVGLAAYRVLQESLSNAMRHAPGAAVQVDLAYHDDRLSLRVENDPPPGRHAIAPVSPAGGPGQGHAGMRERVQAYRGTLRIGPSPAGGFVVEAELPVDGARSPAERP